MQLEGDEFNWDDFFKTIFPDIDIAPGYDPSTDDFFGPQFNRFIELLQGYFEDQDQDDIDRIFRSQEIQEFLSVLYRYENGDATLDDLKAVDTEYLSEIDGWTDFTDALFDTGPDLSELITEYGEDVVNDAKAKYDELVDFIGNVPDDPAGSIKKIIDIYMEGVAGVPSECSDGVAGGPLDEWYKKCVTVGVLIEIGIPGLPGGLGGIFKGATIGEIEEALKKIGKKFEDIVNGTPTCGEDGKQECTPENILGDLAREVIDNIGSIFEDAEGNITVESVLGKLGGIFGSVLGGIIYDQFKDLINEEIEDVIGVPVIPFAPLPECEEKDLETIETSPGQYECGECKQEGFTPTGPQGECIDPNAVDAFDETKCVEETYFNENKADCEAAGYVNCAGGENTGGQETTGGIIKGTLDDCDVIQDPQCSDVGTYDNDPNSPTFGDCVCPEGYEFEVETGGTCGEKTSDDDGTDCPEGQVRRGGLADGECVRPGVVCFSEPSKYTGDDPAINKGQFNSEGFCVAPDGPPPGQTCDNNAVNPDDCDDCGDGTTPDQHINGDCNEDLKNIDGTEGQCPADSERAGQNPLYDGRDTNQSGFFTTPNGITYAYEPCNPSLGFSIVGQDVNVCEDQNNLNYGNIVQQPEEPCGDCKPGFDKPEGYDTCVSIVDVLCKDDNVSGNYEECKTEEPPEDLTCAQQGKVTNKDGSCGGCDTEKGYVLSKLTGRCYIPPEDDCTDDAEGNPRVRDGFGRCVPIGSECRAESFGGQDCRDPETNAYQFGVIDADGSCVCPGDIEEPPEVDCSEITEDNYKDCNKVKCPQNSEEPYADSLDQCVPTTCIDGTTVESGCTECPKGQELSISGGTGAGASRPRCVPKPECSEEDAYTDATKAEECGKVACPQNSEKPFADSLDDCVAAPVVTCQDPNATNYEQKGECGPCKDLYDRPEGYDECVLIETLCQDPQYAEGNELCQGPCADGEVEFVDQNGEIFCDSPCAYNDQIASSSPDCVAPECKNGATDYPDCVTCPSGQRINPETDQCEKVDCTDPANALFCGWVECDDGTMAATLGDCEQETPCSDPEYAAANPLECGWVECPDGSFKETREDCEEGPQKCENGATDYPDCTVCPEGQSMDAEGNCTDCSDCSCAEYAAANPEECITQPPPPPPPETGGGGGGMLGGGSFTPFLAGISYTPQAVPEPPAPAQKDYMAELDNIIKRSLFEGMA